MRVLVIEDDLLFQKVIPTFLKQASGGRIATVLAGALRSGLDELESHEIDAVLLDLTLPDSEGLDTLHRFQREAPHVPVIVLTGLDDDEIAAEAVRRGAQDFLVKSDLSASILTRSIRYAIERTRAEEALRESESRFRAVVEDQTELVCRFEPDGVLTFVNRAFCRYFGTSAAETAHPWRELLGRNFFTLTGVDPYELATLNDPASPTRSREHRLDLEGRPPAWIEWTDRALFDDQGTLVAFQSVGRDNTEQKKLERQLYQSQKTETLGRLAGGVAHDFNNLLTVIIGCCEMLGIERQRSGLGSHPQIVEIGKAAERAAALTRQLLAVSRRHVAQPAVLDLNQVVRQTEEMLRRLIGEQVELRVEFDRELPAIKADRGQIEQIVVNLVVNARDAMPEGGKLTIATSTEFLPAMEGGRMAELSVEDTGVGMDPETRANIFEPFFTTKEVGRGTGLGLSIVDSLVKQSGGSIQLETALGRGSKFRIRFPVTQEESEPVSKPPSRSALPPCRSGSILLVEDESLVREVVTSLLLPQGYQVFSAGSAEEALYQLKDSEGRSFDLLLTDVVLPDKNGFQLADEVRARFPRMRILFMSGYTDAARGNERWLTAGSHFLQKPFSADELLAKLDEALRA